MTTIKKRIHEKPNMIGPDKSMKVCDHAIKCEIKFRAHEHNLVDHIDIIVIDVNKSSDGVTSENN